MIKKISRKAPLFMAACMAFALALAGCGGSGSPADPGPGGPSTFTVMFDSAGGSAVAAQTVTEGGTATAPTTPTRAWLPAGLWLSSDWDLLPDVTAYTFVEWRHGDTAWDFTDIVTANITLTAQWTAPTAMSPVAGVAANDLAEAVAHANANAGAFTLAISQNVTSGTNNLSSDTNLTIIGLGGPREISHTSGWALFVVESSVSNASLTLGDGITLRGRQHSGGLVWIEGSTNTFAMEDGSKITGHVYQGSGFGGAVSIRGGSTFYMRGGTITGNRGAAGLVDVGGVLVSGTGSSLIQTGGTITGNTNTNPSNEHPNVMLTGGATRTVNEEPAGNS